jgi:protein arginine kinase activator
MNCHKKLATVKLTRITNGEVDELYYCADCASEQSPYQKKSQPPLEEILAGILGGSAQEAGARISVGEATCSTCGLPFSNYRETLILGCSDCYASFEQQLTRDLVKFHGSKEHTGRIPHAALARIQEYRNREELSKRLKEAIRAEDFGLAARLRDELKSLSTAAKDSAETAQENS